MGLNISQVLALLLVSATWHTFAEGAKTPTGEVIVAFWNVENLFDGDDDLDNPGDDEYTPASWRRWNHARYRHKLTNLAEVVSAIHPDILCLAEVENRRVLDDLATLLSDRHGIHLPRVIHRDGGDLRGIDTAILSRWEPVNVFWLKPLALQRDLIVADYAVGGKPFTIIVNHWKSRYGDQAVSDGIRELEARTIRAEVDRRLSADPASAIIVTGDFNDNIGDRIPLAVAGFATNKMEVLNDGRLLFNLSANLSEEARGTYYYSRAKAWNCFDMINVSRGLLPSGNPASPWVADPASFGIHAPPKMRRDNGAPYPYRRGTRSRGEPYYHTGYSDHFPVHVTIKARP